MNSWTKNKSVYQRTISETNAADYGIAWQMLAVIHYAESNLAVYNNSNGQGIWQLFDYTQGGTVNVFTPADSVSDEEFLRQTKIAIAEEFIPKIQSLGLSDLTQDDQVKKFFFGYNGMAAVYVNKAISMGFFGRRSVER